MNFLIIEDDAETGRVVVEGLRRVGHAATLIGTLAEGTRRALAEEWDAIVLDRVLPDEPDGLELLIELRSRSITIPVLVLSALSTLDERVRALRAGGDDYLVKPFALDELFARLEALVRRTGWNAETDELVVEDLRLDLRSRRAYRSGQVIPLQPREFRLLEVLARSRGEVVTRQMLLEQVWNYHFDPQTNVIDVQISRLRNKIDRDHEPLIQTIRGIGFALRARAHSAVDG